MLCVLASNTCSERNTEINEFTALYTIWSTSEHLSFILELVYQFLNRADHDAPFPLWRLLDSYCLQSWRDIHSQLLHIARTSVLLHSVLVKGLCGSQICHPRLWHMCHSNIAQQSDTDAELGLCAADLRTVLDPQRMQQVQQELGSTSGVSC